MPFRTVRNALAPIALVTLLAQTAAAEVDDAALLTAADQADEWLTYGRDYSETRFSPLDAINAGNVGSLGLAWDYDAASFRGLEATAIVSDGVYYATTSWSNVFALDAVSGDEIWRWDAEADRVRGARACCDVVNRGVALYEGKIFVGVIDGRLVALDAGSGEPVWDVQTTPVDLPYTITGAPRVVDGKVIIGNGGAELAVRGFVSAYDPDNGELLWRVYTVPGNPDEPFESPALEAAAETWNGEWWTMGGGGTAWDAMAYDAQARLLYIGTGNGSPWNRDVRSPGGGDNLYLSSILALDIDTGDLVWHYQTTPGDNWDYTAVQHLMLAELEIDGRDRQVIMQAPKNGFFYVLDRLTGELLSAEPFVEVSWASGIDMQTGRPIETPQARYTEQLSRIAPGPGGAHNWHPMSFNPQTGLVYLPATQSEFVYSDDENFEHIERAWNLGVRIGSLDRYDERPASEYGPGTGTRLPTSSALLAWDPVAQEARWQIDHANGSGSGTLTTAGNLVFQGTADGKLAAYSADEGEALWEIQLGNGVLAPPMTYAIDGTQYLSVLVGWGGSGALFGYNPAGQYKATGRVMTFVLDGDTDFERIRGQERPMPERVAHDSTPAEVAAGEDLFLQRCSMCHGRGAASGGSIADLRYAVPGTYDIIDNIVRQGAYQQLGMPMFDWFSDDDVAALRAYLLSRRDALIDGE